MRRARAQRAGTLTCRVPGSLDSIKQAAHRFQLAAGAFEAMKDHLRSRAHQVGGLGALLCRAAALTSCALQPMSKDLTVDCASMMVHLMLGQAQECFVINAHRSDKVPLSPLPSPSLILSAASQDLRPPQPAE